MAHNTHPKRKICLCGLDMVIFSQLWISLIGRVLHGLLRKSCPLNSYNGTIPWPPHGLADQSGSALSEVLSQSYRIFEDHENTYNYIAQANFNCNSPKINFKIYLLHFENFQCPFLKDFGPLAIFKIQYFHFWGLNQNFVLLKVLF